MVCNRGLTIDRSVLIIINKILILYIKYKKEIGNPFKICPDAIFHFYFFYISKEAGFAKFFNKKNAETFS
jgi:hypothetical protein